MNANLKLVVIAQEFPFPPNHGGRADIWRRLRALKQLGYALFLVCWCEQDSPPSQQEIEQVRQVVAGLRIITKRKGMAANLQRLRRMLAGTPSHAAARAVDAQQTASLVNELRQFGATAVMLENPYGGLLARALSQTLAVPLFYRSHNIEFLYFASQAAAASQLKNRIAWSLACWHLERFEQALIASAKISFDISADDMTFWRGRGIHNGHWLPPLSEAVFQSAVIPAPAAEAAQLLFLGNLNAPNNVQGVRWLISAVMPLVWAQQPDAQLTIAGSRPTEEVVKLCGSDPRVQLRANVADAPGLMAASGVLLNPVLSGSGVNVKTLDMLMTERPIVSTRQGVAGLVASLQSLCVVADGAEAFAAAVLASLQQPQIDAAARQAGRALFSIDSVAAAAVAMQAQLAAPQARAA
jgi:glycosyltransferase involved in cell wall biosynthesis